MWQATFAEKPQIKWKVYRNIDIYLIHAWTATTFNGTIVNRALPLLHRGSLEITLTDPLKGLNIFNQRETLIFPLPVLYSVLGKNSTRHIHEHPAIQTLVSLFEH